MIVPARSGNGQKFRDVLAVPIAHVVMAAVAVVLRMDILARKAAQKGHEICLVIVMVDMHVESHHGRKIPQTEKSAAYSPYEAASFHPDKIKKNITKFVLGFSKYLFVMIQSMTGYGKAEAVLEGGRLTVEFRSVNGKSADINIKTSLLPKDREMEIRKRIADVLQRGSIDLFLTWEPNAAENARQVNMETAQQYLSSVRSLAETAGAAGSGSGAGLDSISAALLLNAVLRMPDVVDVRKQEIITEDNWPAVSEAVDKALEAIRDYRIKEGAALYRDVTGRVSNILACYDKVEGYEQERITAVREKLEKAAAEFGAKLDKERFEQELIYYIEKLDINEEKVRLRQHCKYFMDTIDGEPYPGKKLGFIIQEMGREINTTGSKANHAEIQKLVVQMKDELEKMREQSMNIL